MNGENDLNKAEKSYELEMILMHLKSLAFTLREAVESYEADSGKDRDYASYFLLTAGKIGRIGKKDNQRLKDKKVKRRK